MFKRHQRNVFEELTKSESLSEVIYLGVQIIEVARVKGSVNRWRDFDHNFRVEGADRAKLQSVTRAMEEGVVFPPIEVYKIRNEYYIIDGNHRVAAAKQIGQVYIDAEVKEMLPPADSDEHRLWREQSQFEWKTGFFLDLSGLGFYNRLLVYIRLFSKQYNLKNEHQLNLKEAAVRFKQEVYEPVLQVIERQQLQRSLPGYTQDDLFLYVIHHLLTKAHFQRRRVSVAEAVQDFCLKTGDQPFNLLNLLKGMGFKKPCKEPCFSCANQCPEGFICSEDGRLTISDQCQGCGKCTSGCTGQNLIPYEELVDWDGMFSI